MYARILNKRDYAAYVRPEIHDSKGLFCTSLLYIGAGLAHPGLLVNSAFDRPFRAIVSSTHSIQDGALHVVGRTSIVCLPIHLTWKHSLDMPILITTLLAVVFASCLRDTLALNVVLQAEDTHSRSQWGVDDILLTCRSGTNTIHNAIFTRDEEAITISDYDDCTPGGNQYCYTEGGERLSSGP